MPSQSSFVINTAAAFPPKTSVNFYYKYIMYPELKAVGVSEAR